MRYLSVCSGIEAATVAWEPLGWEPAAFSEIEKFPRAVLQHHYPNVPLHGDFRNIKGNEYGAIDILVGGTPCQAFSVAGDRKGLEDPRGNLTLEFFALVGRIRPLWVVWENVPGVLSLDKGRTFGTILGALAKLGYGWAYRILDAQFLGVPQKRRRVFLVGYLGGAGGASKVLFESPSVRRDTPKGRKTKSETTGTVEASSGRRRGSGMNPSMITATLTTGYGERSGQDLKPESLVFGGNNTQGSIQVAAALNANRGCHNPGDFEAGNRVAEPITARPYADSAAQENKLVMTFAQNASGHVFESETANSLGTNSNATGRNAPLVRTALAGAVRRFTPLECERLQGFPDNYTLVPYRNSAAKDTPRYEAIGNSMAVPVMRWIGERIDAVNSI